MYDIFPAHLYVITEQNTRLLSGGKPRGEIAPALSHVDVIN